MKLSGRSKNSPLLAFFGHHKCGTSWIKDIIDGILFQDHFITAHITKPSDFDYDLTNYINKNEVDFLYYTNANFKYVRLLNNYKGFHVVRDPRDLCISAYFSHLYSHPIHNWPALEAHRKLLKRLSIEDGLLEDLKFVRRYMKEIESWDYENSNILEIRFEKLIEDPLNTFIDILNFLELQNHDTFQQRKTFSIENIKFIIDKHSFLNKSGGRIRGMEDVHSHYRKGISGDWKKHFTKTHINFFKKNYNLTLIKAGYEVDSKW